MKRTVVLIICLFVLLNISSFFVIRTKSPQYTVYTGAVHYPPDYLYYLSFISQGREHWIMGSNLKSGETMSLDFLNWVYVLGGHIGSLFHISPVWTYQLLVIGGSIVYMLAAYWLFSLLFPKRPTSRLVGFVLFLLSNAFPRIYRDHGTWIFSFFYPFNNLGHAFERLTNVPHHLFISAGILSAFAASITYWQSRKPKFIVILVLLGIWLGGMQPLQWAFITGVLGIGGLFSWWKHRTPGERVNMRDVLAQSYPAIALFAGGLPFAVYIKLLFSSPVYAFMMDWERQQQVYISFVHFIRLNGPVMLLGVLGLPFLIKSVTVSTFPLYLYSVLSVGVLFTRIPERLGFLNLRFESVMSTLTAAYISASVLWNLAAKFAPTQKKAFAWFSAFLLLAITIPVTISHLTLDRVVTYPNDLNIFLPLGAYQTYQIAAKTIAPDEVTLVTPLYTLSFPAFTGRHVFSADSFGTLNFARKGKEAVDFFNAVSSDGMRVKWLADNRISYVFTNAWAPITLPNLTVVYKNDFAILYKVNKAN